MNDSIAKQVRELLKQKPFLEEAIILKVANISKISELLKNEIKGASFHAVHAALRRQANILNKERGKIHKKVINLLKKSEISLKSGLIDVRLKLDYKTEEFISYLINKKVEFTIMRGQDIITIIISKDFHKLFEKIQSKIIESNEGLTSISIKSPKHLYTIGFAAFITNLISREGINMIDFMSSYNITTIIVNKKDAGRIYNLLTNFIE